MKIRHKKNIFYAIIAFFLIMIPVVVFINDQISKRNLVKSISSVKQVYFWTFNYEDITGDKPKDLPSMIEKFVELNPTDEFDDMLLDYKLGKIYFNPEAISNETLIKWQKNENVITMAGDGFISVENKH